MKCVDDADFAARIDHYARRLQVEVGRQPDFGEGLAAFREMRAAVFAG